MFEGLKVFLGLGVLDITVWQACVCLALAFVLAAVLKYLLGKIWEFIKKLFVGVKKSFKKVFKSYRKKCSEIQCPFCGKTLDHCACAKNQGRSYRERFKTYKKWKKRRASAQKTKKSKK